jgi:succinate dehydrogenase / fumarate reductase cytochrome b subunit
LATTSFDPTQLDQKYHFLLRKLHSLTGIVPIGVFLFEHMLTNSMAFAGGRVKFNESVHFLHDLPYLLALEVFGIFLPLAFHAIYGIAIAWSGKSNVASYPYMDNRRYFLQRLSGYIAVAFLILHLMKFRFAHWFDWGPEYVGSTDPFEITRVGLQAWNPAGDFIVPAWITFTIYWIGLAAACYHFANGIWSFCISWGITIGEKAQRRIGVVGALVGLLLFTWGSLGLYAFARAPEPGTAAPGSVIVEHSSPAVSQTPRNESG